jgi:hypothetical protein
MRSQKSSSLFTVDQIVQLLSRAHLRMRSRSRSGETSDEAATNIPETDGWQGRWEDTAEYGFYFICRLK